MDSLFASIPSEIQKAVDFPEWGHAVKSLSILSLAERLSGIHTTTLDNSQNSIHSNNPAMSQPASDAHADSTSGNPTLTGQGSQSSAGTWMGGQTTPLFIDLRLWFGESENFMIWWKPIKLWVKEQIENRHSTVKIAKAVLMAKQNPLSKRSMGS